MGHDQLRRLANLDRLPEDLTAAVERVLDHVAHIESVDTTGIPPTYAFPTPEPDRGLEIGSRPTPGSNPADAGSALGIQPSPAAPGSETDSTALRPETGPTAARLRDLFVARDGLTLRVPAPAAATPNPETDER